MMPGGLFLRFVPPCLEFLHPAEGDEAVNGIRADRQFLAIREGVEGIVHLGDWRYLCVKCNG